MTYQNDSFIVEQFYENVYQRSETVETKTCPTCDGSGREFYSNCCGETIINGICTDCKKPCHEDSEPCGTCQGEGEVTV